MLTGIRRPFWGQIFEASASGIWLLAVQNTAPEQLRIGAILSVRDSVQLFAGHFLEQVDGRTVHFSEKKSLKNGNLNRIL